ncbi:MAG: DNA-directed RNA polymerase subunit beta, partial [Clostridiales bacterium]|nr:DNA-directed RNA polymerase subunit beta [Clostridiales bacterium]
MPHPVQLGRTERMSFSKIEQLIQLPNLIEIQKKSYEWFLKEGLAEAFNDISPIEGYTGSLVLEFIGYEMEKEPKYDIEECKERDVTYSVPLKVKVRFINRESGEIKEQKVFMGDFPLMTFKGTFIINGAERVIVSQLVRSPGPYYGMKINKNGSKLFSTQVIPNRGAWLEYETDANDILYVRIDRTRKIPLTVLIRAMGYSTDSEIISLFGEDERLSKTLEKDTTTNKDEALLEIYKRLRPGEPPTIDSATSLLNNLFFDEKRYDLARVGRYKYNKKLGISNRLEGKIAAEDIINPDTGEILIESGQKISKKNSKLIENAGIKDALVKAEADKNVKVIGNNFVDINNFIKDLG